MKMSLKTNKVFLLACLFVAGFMFLQSCEKKLEELSEGTLVEIDTDLFHTPGMVRFEDAKDGSTLNNVTVAFTGDNADLLYSTSGKATLKPVEGFMDIAIDETIAISESSPFTFTILASAPGYLPAQKTIILTELNDNQPETWFVSLVKVDDAPEGVIISNNTFSAGADGVAQELTYQANSTDETAPTVTIPQGTKLLNAGGNQVNGQAAFQMVYFDQTVEEIDAYQPNANKLQMADGSITFGALGTIAYFDMSMKVGNTSIKSFSQPLLTTIKLPADYINPDTEMPLQAGDVISAWSIEEGTDVWVFEADYAVQEDSNGDFFVEVEMSHFSGWAIVVSTTTAPTYMSIYNMTINSDIPGNLTNAEAYGYYSEIQYRYRFPFFGITNYRYGSYSQWRSTPRYFRNGEVINVPFYVRFPYFEHRILVYNGKRGCKRTLITSSNWFRPIHSPTVTLNNLYNPEYLGTLDDQISVAISAKCDGVTVKPTGYLLMRGGNSSCPYQLQGTVINGQISFNKGSLLYGETSYTKDTKYDWKMIWNEDAYEKINLSFREMAYSFYEDRDNPQTGRPYTNEEVDELLDTASGTIQLFQFDLTQAECDDLTGG